jgi:hypothetical protein
LMAGKRQMIFAPELNAGSFVFFFEKGDKANSWSVRDYSAPRSMVGPRYAAEFNFTLEELLREVVMRFDAPAHATTDLDYWHQHTLKLNQEYLVDRESSTINAPISEPVAAHRGIPDADGRQAFPIIGRAEFDQHPKSRKPEDRNRMLYAPESEDWVTWTTFRLLELLTPQTWWADLVALAKTENRSLVLPPGWDRKPEFRLWKTIASPAGYETASRERMRSSGNTEWVARSHKPEPVEGRSEIDVILCNSTMLVFAEAKLGCDVSSKTKYDPRRNQIVRNIDCVLDHAGDRVPMFWMLVRDVGHGRSYVQLLSHYRAEPDVLVSELPHHDPTRVVALAQSLSLILWKDLVHAVVHIVHHDDEQTISIKNELWRRVTSCSAEASTSSRAGAGSWIAGECRSKYLPRRRQREGA